MEFFSGLSSGLGMQWRHNAETLTDALRSADLEGQQLQPHFQFAHGGDSAVVGNRSTTVDVEAALAKWSWHTSNAWKAARTSNWGFHAWNVALHCIHAGCRVIFLPVPCGGEVPSSRLRASPGAVQHLGDIKGLLSECLVFWEEQRVSDPACMLLPGALIWGRAMLHWFQLVLSNNDPRLSLSGDFFEDSRLAKAVRGFDRGSSFRPGRAHLCQRLLLAQAVSLASETEYLELLPSALPATVSLAKLLLTRVTHKGWQDSREADSEQPPPPGISLVVPTEPLFESVNGFKRLSVPVEVVQMGSAAALRVASSHLKAILARVRLSGAPLQDLASVRHASDVGGSVILWEAVCLCKAINEELAET